MQFSHVSNKFLTFGAAHRQYAPETRQKHHDCLVSWLLPALGSREIEILDITDALRIRNVMEGRVLSGARISSVLSTLKALLNFSRTVLKLECMNPAEIKLPPKPKPNVKFLTDPEIDRARATLNPHRFTDRRNCSTRLGHPAIKQQEMPLRWSCVSFPLLEAEQRVPTRPTS